MASIICSGLYPSTTTVSSMLAAATASKMLFITVVSFRRSRSLFCPILSDFPAARMIAAVIINNTTDDENDDIFAELHRTS